jgi:hypothetical protein
MEPKKKAAKKTTTVKPIEATKAELLAQSMDVPLANLDRLYNFGKNLWPEEESVDDFLSVARNARGRA